MSDAPVHDKEEIEGVIAAQARMPGGGLIVMPDAFTNTNTELIIARRFIKSLRHHRAGPSP